MNFSVIYDHSDFVVLAKPANLNFHTVDQQAGFVVQAEQQLGYKVWPVHRLDKITSGLLILAKSAEAAAEFYRLFEQRQIEKFYIALSKDKPKKKQGLIRGDMGKGRNGSWMLLRSQNDPAITQFFSYGLGDGLRLFLLKPHTGRTHQLRVALKSIGSPILGDSRYSGQVADRGYLHALGLRFNWQEQEIKLANLSCCEGEAMALLDDALIAKLKQPWDVSFPRLKS